MNTIRIFLATISLLFFGTMMAQDEEVNNSFSIESLLESKNFEFIANTMLPLSGPSKNLVGDGYSVVFSKDSIVSDLPYYGRAYRGLGTGKYKGMRFQGKPNVFTVEKGKRFQINVVVKDGETYELSLSVSDSGYATLNITNNTRDIISYQGEVVSIK